MLSNDKDKPRKSTDFLFAFHCFIDLLMRRKHIVERATAQHQERNTNQEWYFQT